MIMFGGNKHHLSWGELIWNSANSPVQDVQIVSALEVSMLT